tara:strand:- start:141564 stop:143504 length:1941 start_codon:yes stop_codon:yes gene_type:complete
MAQEDFDDMSELEAELESLEDTEINVESDSTFDDVEVESADSGVAEEEGSFEDDFGDEDFADEDFEDDFSDEDFADEDFADEDFADEDFEDDFSDEELAEEGDALGDQSLEDVLEEDDSLLDEEIAEDALGDEEFEAPTAVLEDESETVLELDVEENAFQPYKPDAPDLDYEKQLNQIFNEYYSQPLSDNEWLGITGDRILEKYVIQAGDTLWDVSDTFFGDGFYWSKVWSLNSKIENPHIIEPTNVVQFQLGDVDDAPSFQIFSPSQVGPVDNPAPFVTRQAIKQADDDDLEFGDEDEIEIPPPVRDPTPVVNNLPPSLPGLEPSREDDDDLVVGLARTRELLSNIKNRKQINYYISDREPKGIGRVLETDIGSMTAGPGQYVFVEMKEGVGKPGQIFKVVEKLGDLDAVNTFMKDAPEVDDVKDATIVEVVGEIQLREKVDAKIEKNTVYRAYVNKATSMISLGAVLLDGRIETVDINTDGEKVYIEGFIVGGAGSVARNVYAQGEIIFLDKGTNQGLAPGYILPIRHNRTLRHPKSNIFDDGQLKGFVKVVDVSENFSTAVIVQSKEDIFNGDYVGNDGYVAEVQSDSTLQMGGVESTPQQVETANAGSSVMLDTGEEDGVDEDFTEEDFDDFESVEDDGDFE